ncbi:MAG: hypothetical protein R8J85_04560 [Mariprofundales bacterium]
MLLDTISEHGATLMLYQHGDAFSIRVDREGELMNSRNHYSEDQLAALACAHLAKIAAPRLLVGGLGMGFTLAAALSHANSSASVMVAELLPAVVGWNRDYLGAAAGFPLDDGRVTVVEADVGKVMRQHQGCFDAIMLDVDNGPDGFTRDANDALYNLRGLNSAYNALQPNGVLTVWSVLPDAAFTQRMCKVGFDVEQRSVRAYNTKSKVRHTIWVGRRIS